MKPMLQQRLAAMIEADNLPIVADPFRENGL
jgi:hypothetical protein